MRYKFEKNMRILTDLITYCHQHGSRDYEMRVHFGKSESTFEISAPTPELSDAQLERLIRKLNLPRQYEMEQNYWGLTGEPETDAELMLVGMMIDEAEVTLENGVLHILARRTERKA